MALQARLSSFIPVVGACGHYLHHGCQSLQSSTRRLLSHSRGVSRCGILHLFYTANRDTLAYTTPVSKRPDRDVDIQWTISPERLSTITPHGTSEFKWRALSKVILTTDGFLLYPIDQIFHFLPRRGFCDDTDFHRLAELAKTRAPKFIQMA